MDPSPTQRDSTGPRVSADAHAMMLFEAHKKSIALAYVLWWFLGWAGGHRFYLGRGGSAVLMLLLWVLGGALSFVLIGYPLLLAAAVWWLLDAFMIPGWISEHNERLAAELAQR
jgi:TM2 domain-containing membrane protein YozV